MHGGKRNLRMRYMWISLEITLWWKKAVSSPEPNIGRAITDYVQVAQGLSAPGLFAGQSKAEPRHAIINDPSKLDSADCWKAKQAKLPFMCLVRKFQAGKWLFTNTVIRPLAAN
ncbi:hypothetical protein ACFOLF_01040 [Paenibacillus sepulcri]|uniref:Uncharacterized protein n=1 Tax=Paenibacillus sepulcri TaxID=359917 RepID=A0ABS7C788_9BACL|nr:hypothetical protein [Paenibacillus sepulcri]